MARKFGLGRGLSALIPEEIFGTKDEVKDEPPVEQPEPQPSQQGEGSPLEPQPSPLEGEGSPLEIPVEPEVPVEPDMSDEAAITALTSIDYVPVELEPQPDPLEGEDSLDMSVEPDMSDEAAITALTSIDYVPIEPGVSVEPEVSLEPEVSDEPEVPVEPEVLIEPEPQPSPPEGEGSPLEVPVEPEVSLEPEVSDEPEVPVEQEISDEPEVPVEQEISDEPEAPVEQEISDEPEIPVEPEVSLEPEVPVEPEIPLEPEIPVEPEVFLEPEVPVESEDSVEPEVSIEPEVSLEPEVFLEPEVPVESEDSVEPEPQPSPPEGEGSPLEVLVEPEVPVSDEGGDLPLTQDAVVQIAVDKLVPNPSQPRKNFDETELQELADSIKEHGVIMPIIAADTGDGSYTIIAGERRTRAARLAGLEDVPVIIRDYTDLKRMEISLIENIQRSDLNPIEEAVAYKNLMDFSNLSQGDLAARVGKNRSTVTNALRLLKLSAEVQKSLETGDISSGHARALLSVTNKIQRNKLFKEITAKGLSVREAEKKASALNSTSEASDGSDSVGGKVSKRPPEITEMEEKFIEKLGTKVTIDGGLDKGRIHIDYYSMEDLDRLYEIIGG